MREQEKNNNNNQIINLSLHKTNGLPVESSMCASMMVMVSEDENSFLTFFFSNFELRQMWLVVTSQSEVGIRLKKRYIRVYFVINN